MEQDILRNTGCVWSRILFPGFKGNVNSFEKQDIQK
jgi:hypothetical protein